MTNYARMIKKLMPVALTGDIEKLLDALYDYCYDLHVNNHDPYNSIEERDEAIELEYDMRLAYLINEGYIDKISIEEVK